MMRRITSQPSPQSRLWTMLTARQQAEVAAVFRHLKMAAQIQLCYVLMDYIEYGSVPVFSEDEVLPATAFTFLTSYGMDEKAPWRIKANTNE